VAVDGLSVRCGGRAVLRDIVLRATRGELVRVVGPAGAGKSMLMRAIAGLLRPAAGTVRIAQADPYDLKRGTGPALRRTLGLLLQDPLLLPELTALQNVALPACAAGLSPREAADRAHRAIASVGCPPEFAACRVGELPRSDQQRIALARALVHRPALLLLDEPTAHLGETAATAFTRSLAQFVASGVTVIAMTQGAFAPHAARDVRLVDGRIVP
jgi:ABC-type lipoprotein export system ATPase subunit